MNNRKRFLRIALVVLPALVTACTTVGPDYRAPALPELEPADLQIEGSALDERETIGDWWHQFGDDRLEGLIRLARINNTSLALAKQRLSQALAVFDRIEGLDRPRVDADASYRYLNLRDIATGRRAEFDELSLGGRIGWELDLFGRVARATEAARADAEAAAIRWQAVQRGLIAGVSARYGELIVNRSQLDLARQNRDSLRETLALVERRAEEGLVSGFDPVAVRAEIAALTAEIPQLAHNLERNRNALAALIGVEPGDLPALDDVGLPQVQTSLAVTDPLALFRQRADIRVAERQLAAATADVGVAVADFYPRIRLDGFVGFLAASPAALLQYDARAIEAGPSLTWQLFDRRNIEARVAIAESDVEIAALRYRQVFLDALTETRNAFDGHRQAQRASMLRDIQVRESRQARKLARQQYREGYIDLIALLEAERAVYQAWRDQLVSDLRVYRGVVAIYDALAGGTSG